MGISVVVITKNEESNIGECLSSVAWADEIVVVDSGSTDRTVDICRGHAAKVVVSPQWPGFGAQKNLALDLASHDWVLSLDADERVTPELCRELQAVAAGPATHDAYEMPRSSSYCGRFMRHGGWWPDRVLRFFRRGKARFSNDLVHERLLVQGSVGRLVHPLVHYAFGDLEEVLHKVNQYSSAGALMLHDRGRTGSLRKAVFHGTWAFFRTYVLKAGFLDGQRGFMLAVSNAEGTYYRYLKLMLLRERH